jgi:hypothetical protein
MSHPLIKYCLKQAPTQISSPQLKASSIQKQTGMYIAKPFMHTRKGESDHEALIQA